MLASAASFSLGAFTPALPATTGPRRLAEAGCPCATTTSVHTGSALTITLGGASYTYESTYGLSTCTAHDATLAPYCSQSDPPKWCSDSWCYVDSSNCDQPSSKSVYLSGLSYSYFTCGGSNTFDAWFGTDTESGSGEAHALTELVSLMHQYTESISDTLEENYAEAQAASGCSPASSCPCADCVAPSTSWQSSIAGITTPNMTLSGATYKTRPGTSSTSSDATTDQCLANIVTSSFTRIAATESDPDRIGFEYYGSQSLGNYIQWPGMQDCDAYDPRYRPWYAAAASGPKDVVLVIDTSGSMSGTREAMARAAATMVIDTLTSSDYVSIVRFSSSASSYDVDGAEVGTLVQATDATKTAMKSWIATNIDASGGTNFEAAFEKMWQVIDATTTSSGCNRVILFLSDGEPSNWSDSIKSGLQTKAASYTPQVHLLTYALGSNAPSDILQEMACASGGIFYQVDTTTIADTMASYFQVLAPMLSPCRVRWVRYNDYYTGTELLGACLASFEKESATAATSCNGGLSGLGETGDARVPKLIGVGCVDMNLVVDLPTLEAHADYGAFRSLVAAEMAECSRISLTEDQMETLRAEVGAYSVCGTGTSGGASSGEDACEAYTRLGFNATACELFDCCCDGVCEDDDDVVGAIVGILFFLCICGSICAGVFFLCTRMNRRAAPPPTAPQPGVQMPPMGRPAVAQPQAYGAQPMAYGAQPMAAQPMAMATAVPMQPQGYGAQPVQQQGYPAQASGYPAAVAMGTVVG